LTFKLSSAKACHESELREMVRSCEEQVEVLKSEVKQAEKELAAVTAQVRRREKTTK